MGARVIFQLRDDVLSPAMTLFFSYALAKSSTLAHISFQLVLFYFFITIIATQPHHVFSGFIDDHTIRDFKISEQMCFVIIYMIV